MKTVYAESSLKIITDALALMRDLSAKEQAISSDQAREALAAHIGNDSVYPYMFGQLSAECTLATINGKPAYEHALLLQSLLKGVSADITPIGKGAKVAPEWSLSVPNAVTLQCPNCGADCECDVSKTDDDENGITATYSAQIDFDTFCEDCGRNLCHACKRFPHPDDKDLAQCETCHARAR
jgi:hypothetical protein